MTISIFLVYCVVQDNICFVDLDYIKGEAFSSKNIFDEEKWWNFLNGDYISRSGLDDASMENFKNEGKEKENNSKLMFLWQHTIKKKCSWTHAAFVSCHFSFDTRKINFRRFSTFGLYYLRFISACASS